MVGIRVEKGIEGQAFCTDGYWDGYWGEIPAVSQWHSGTRKLKRVERDVFASASVYLWSLTRVGLELHGGQTAIHPLLHRLQLGMRARLHYPAI